MRYRQRRFDNVQHHRYQRIADPTSGTSECPISKMNAIKPKLQTCRGIKASLRNKSASMNIRELFIVISEVTLTIYQWGSYSLVLLWWDKPGTSHVKTSILKFSHRPNDQIWEEKRIRCFKSSLFILKNTGV